MNKKKTLMIIEQVRSDLKMTNDANSDVIYLEGIFTEFMVRNRNGRIYEAKDFVPKMNELMPKVQNHTLLGELDHPTNFDVSLKNASHVIEKLEYDEQNNRIMGKIRLLNTDSGKQAQALVKDGIPLHISSRAAGQIDANGKVTLEKLFTYDLVADPGFENAELRRVNESYGFGGFDNVAIYECDYIPENEEKNTNNNMNTINEEKSVRVEDFQKYTEYIAGVIENVKSSISDLKKQMSVNESMSPKQASDTDAQIKKLTSYVDYLAEQIENSANYSEYVAEQLDKNISYSNYLAENVNNSIEYGKYLGEKLDENFQHNNYLAETIQKVADHSDYIAEELQKVADHSDYLAEELQKNYDHNDYLAETIQKVADHSDYVAEELQKVADHSDYLAESMQKVADHSDYLAEKLEQNFAHNDYLAEMLDRDYAYNDYLAENLQKVADHSDYLAESMQKVADHSDYLAEKLEQNFAHNDYLAEKLEQNFAHNDYLAEKLDDSYKYSDYLAENMQKIANHSDYLAEELQKNYDHNDYLAEKLNQNFAHNDYIAEKLEEVASRPVVALNENFKAPQTNMVTPNMINENVNTAASVRNRIKSNDNYKSAISEKLDAILAKADSQISKVNFVNFLSEGRQKEYNQLDTNTQQMISEAMNVAQVKNAEQANIVWKSVYESKKGLDIVENMPEVYKEKWNALSDNRKAEILNEAKFYNIKSTNEIEYFWSTRDLRNNTVICERVDTDSAKTWNQDTQSQNDYISSILGRTKRGMRGF